MKVFTAHFCHETDVSSSIPTTLKSYREDFLCLPSEPGSEALLAGILSRRNLFSILRDRGHEVMVGLIAVAMPGRPTSRRDYELLKGELLANLRATAPVDAVLLSLHGAQVAEGLDDCETDIVRAVRAIVGDAVPIGVILDLHGNVGPSLLEAADIVMAGIEYPHIDMAERGEHLVKLVERVVAGDLKPKQALATIPMTGLCFTTREPLKSLLRELTARQGTEGIAAFSFMHGFEKANVARGAGVIIVSERDEAHAQEVADEIARGLFAVREAIINRPLSIAEAVRRAAAAQARPALIAEVTDNPGGGGAGDATFLLAEMLAADLGRSLFGLLCDPMAVKAAMDLEIGVQAPLRIGGKSGIGSGPPLDVEATILGHHPQLVQRSFAGEEDLGPAASIRVGQTDIVLASKRQQVLSPSCFRSAGLDPAGYDAIGIKSMHHFHAAFSSLAPTILYAGHVVPGTSLNDRLARPIWPLDATPFVVGGVSWGEEEAP